MNLSYEINHEAAAPLEVQHRRQGLHLCTCSWPAVLDSVPVAALSFILWLLFLCRVWYWGYISFYDSSGYVQELGASLEESRAQLNFLQQHTWIDNM